MLPLHVLYCVVCSACVQLTLLFIVCASLHLHACVCGCVCLQHVRSINEATVKRRRSAPFWTSPRSSSQVPVKPGLCLAAPRSSASSQQQLCFHL